MTEYEPTEAEIDDALAFIRTQRGGDIESLARALKARDAKVRAEPRVVSEQQVRAAHSAFTQTSFGFPGAPAMRAALEAAEDAR